MPTGAFTSALVHVPLVFLLIAGTFLTFLPAPALFLTVSMALLVLLVLLVVLVLPVLPVLVLLVLLILPAVVSTAAPMSKSILATARMHVPSRSCSNNNTSALEQLQARRTHLFLGQQQLRPGSEAAPTRWQ